MTEPDPDWLLDIVEWAQTHPVISTTIIYLWLGLAIAVAVFSPDC